jgi:transcriptional regulator with XRE-family HTH domain
VKLQEARKEKGLTQQQIQEQTGISQVIVSYIEREVRNLTAEQKKLLEELLGTIDWSGESPEEEGRVQQTYFNEFIAAKKMDYPVQTLRNWRSNGTGPPYFKISNSVRYNDAGIDDFMAKHRVETDTGAC